MFTTSRRRRHAVLVAAVVGSGILTAGSLVPVSGLRAVAATAPELFPNSPFDHSIMWQPVAPESVALSASFNQEIGMSGSHVVGVNFLPIFTVPSTQPSLPVQVQPGCGDFVNGTPGGTGTVPIPPGAYQTPQPDGEMVVYQPSSDTGWELWRVGVPTGPQNQWSACWGGGIRSVSKSSGVFSGPYGSSASGLSYLATTITERDVAAGQIDHTIALQIPTCNGHIAPAVRNDGTGCNVPGTPPEGTWFRMPWNVPMPTGLTPFAQMVFRALQNYGMIVIDEAGDVMLQAESPRDWTFEGNSGTDPIQKSFGVTNNTVNPPWAVLNGIPWGSIQAICAPNGAARCLA